MVTNTILQPSEFDALIKLKPNEPYFALTGDDPLAPPLVEEWAERERNLVRSTLAGKKHKKERERRLRKATDAEQIAWSMREYKKGATTPIDTGEQADTKPVHYSGHVLPAATIARDEEKRKRVRAAQHMNEAAAQLQSALELMKSLDLDDEADLLRDERDSVNELREQILPERPAIDHPELDLASAQNSENGDTEGDQRNLE